MNPFRARLVAAGALVAIIAGVALAAIALTSSDVRAARPRVTYSEEAPGMWKITEPAGANGRQQPGYAGAIIVRLPFADVVASTGRLAQVQRETWRQVASADGDLVWVLGAYLSEIDDVTPPTTVPPTTVPPTTVPPTTVPPTTTPPTTTPPTTTPPTTTPPTTVPPQPVFDTEALGLWRVTGIDDGGRLNVRSQPGTAGGIVARLDHDAVDIRSTGRIATLDGDLWRQVEYRTGAAGWVDASFLGRYVAPPPKPVFGTEKKALWDVTGLADGFLNVRSAPGTHNPVEFRFPHDTVAIPGTGRTATLDGALWREVQWADVGHTGWVSARYLKAHVAPPPPPPVRSIVVMGDWDGDGTRTPALFRDGTWFVRLSNTAGPADLVLTFGQRGDLPVAGDWDGDGIETVGVVRNGTWHLRNAHSSGPADTVFAFGNAGDTPIAGDWDGNGTDTPGVVRGATWHLRNANSQGPADVTFDFGNAGDTPITGDWDGNGTDTPGVVRGATWHLRNALAGGNADVTFAYEVRS